MMPIYVGAVAAGIGLIFFAVFRFRPLFSVSLGILSSVLALHHRIHPLAALGLGIGVAILTEILMIRIWQWFATHPPDDPNMLRLIGKTGKLRDVVDNRRSLFLLHCEDGDWISVPETPGGVSLGDRVQVAAIRGKAAVVRRAVKST